MYNTMFWSMYTPQKESINLIKYPSYDQPISYRENIRNLFFDQVQNTHYIIINSGPDLV